MSKHKRGELEAILILENLGIEIDKDYYDDNSKKSMPDIKCKDGHYIEVTHTLHNDALQTEVSNYFKLQSGEDWNDYIQRHSRIEKECSAALKRLDKMDYERDEERKFTEAGKKQYNKDVKIVKNHMGYDYKEPDFDKRYSEFKCDCPSYIFSPKNILREITEDKGKKYPNGDVDLFVFATDKEFSLMQKLILQKDWNGVAVGFLKKVLSSPFPKVYICEWDFDKQKYNTNNPQLILFYKCDGMLKWEYHNIK